MRNKRQLRATLESRIEEIVTEVAPVVEPAIMTEVPEGGAVPEEAIVVIDSSDVELEAVQRAQAETVDTVDAIDALAAAATQLDNVRSNIVATLPNGGMTVGEATAYSAATDVIVSDLGVTEVLPSLECFGGTMSRLQATQESISSITAVLKRIFDRGIELLQSLLERIGKLAVRIFEYFTSDKSRLEKYGKILSAAQGNRMVSFKVANDTATLLGLSGNGRFDAGNVSKLLGVLCNTAREGVDFSVGDSTKVISGKASAITPIIFGATTKTGSQVKSESINGVQIVETLPSGDSDFTSYDIEVNSPENGDSAVEVSMSTSDLSALLKLLNSVSDKVLRDLASTAKGAKIGANTISWFVEKFGEDDAQEYMGNWRHLVLARAGVAPQALGVYNRIVQGAMSALSKGTAGLGSKAAPAGLPNKA